MVGALQDVPSPAAGPGLSPEALAALALVMKAPYEGTFGDKRAGTYDFVNEKGKSVGGADIDYDPSTRRVNVQSISSDLKSPLGNNSAAIKGNDQAHALGHGRIRELVNALRNQFPDMERVIGIRGSGARELYPGAQPWADAKVKPMLPAPLGLGDPNYVRPPTGAMPGTRLTDLW
jgi:hypothetical protein